MKKHAIQNALRSQMFIGLLLFFILSIMGAIFSGALVLNNINFKTVTFHFPTMSLNYTTLPDYGLWIGILATSATLAAFLSNYLGKHSFITYKFVNYPEDHLRVMKFIRGEPQKAINVADEFRLVETVLIAAAKIAAIRRPRRPVGKASMI